MGVILIIACAAPIYAADYHVALSGRDVNPGSADAPFATIQRGVSLLKPGDRLMIHSGSYHESIQIQDLKGSTENPIVISAFADDKVVLDGTVPVSSIAEGSWEPYRAGIYSIKLSRDIWQLIAEGEIQTTARWPNAFWQDESIFDQKRWAMGSEIDEWYDYPKRGLTGDYGIMGNTPDKIEDIDLKQIDFDLTGAVAVLNIANFDTYSFPVIKHDVQNGTFSFQIPQPNGIFHRPMYKSSKDDKTGKLVYRFHKYFFEGKLELLDAPGEWHYDKSSKTLYYYPVGDAKPALMDIRGKVQTYVLDVRGSQHLSIRGIDFFGATMQCINNQYLTVENCDFLYPSYSKRVLGEWSPVETTVFYQAERKSSDFNRHTFDISRLTLRNCTFKCADGDAVKIQGLQNTVDNCFFHKIDYSCVDESSDPEIGQLPGNGGTIHTWWSPGALIRRCTIDLAGEGHNFMGGKYSARHKTGNIIEYCRASRCGRLHAQDGANFHVWQFDCDFMILRYNWAHATGKFPFRLDGIYHEEKDRKPYLDHCLLYRLVAFNSVDPEFADPVSGRRMTGNPGIAVKGDWHRTYHTSSFDNNVVGLYVRNEGGGGNMHSDTRNNASMCISGGRSGKPGLLTSINGTERANWSAAGGKLNMRDVLRDVDNLDFRPRKGSPLIDTGESAAGVNDRYVGTAPDIGAYEYGDSEYWIPGYQAPQASTPIPPDGTATAKKDCDLMWLGGYKALVHHLYFGDSAESLERITAGDTSHALKAGCANNIVNPGILAPGKTYYWRVDVAGAEGCVVKGTIWSFSVAAIRNADTVKKIKEQK